MEPFPVPSKPKLPERKLLFKYVNGEFTPLSKPFKTKDKAETARLKLPGAGAAVGCGGRDSNQAIDVGFCFLCHFRDKQLNGSR